MEPAPGEAITRRARSEILEIRFLAPNTQDRAAGGMASLET